MPNYIWGHPEFNDDPTIMAKYDNEPEGIPQTPWGLHTPAKPNAFGAVFDALVAFVILAVLSLVCEASIRSAGRQFNSHYFIASFVLMVAVFAVLTSLFIVDIWWYAVAAFGVIAASVMATGIILSRGYE